MIWHLIGIFGFIVAYNVFRYWREEDKEKRESVEELAQENETQKEKKMEETISTRQLVLNTIEKIGSVPTCTEDGRIRFDYQGITFLMEASNGCAFVNLIWPWCFAFSKFDIDEFSRVRQVINTINAQGTVSAFYGYSDADEVAVHLKKHFLFDSEITDLSGYLRAILDLFFNAARELQLMVEKSRMKEQER